MGRKASTVFLIVWALLTVAYVILFIAAIAAGHAFSIVLYAVLIVFGMYQVHSYRRQLRVLDEAAKADDDWTMRTWGKK